MKRAPAAALAVALLLAGCGGGGSGGMAGGGASGGGGSGADGGDVSAALADIPTLPEGGVPGPEGPPFSLHDYTLVSSTRLSRTVYENVYRVDASNWSGADVALTATLGSNAANVTIVDGEVSFGDVSWGQTVTSSDTFTIRQDRGTPFDGAHLLWITHATALPPTTFALIDAAVTGGAINAETGLLYKVYYEFGDSRLPAQYIGRDDGLAEGRALREARLKLASLSPDAQVLLAPFFLRPTEAGSWNEVQAGASATQAPAGRATAKAAPAVAGTVAWDSVVVNIGGLPKARVWWQPVRRPQDEGQARALRDELELYLWEKVTDTFGEPLADDVIPGVGANPNPYGPDGLLDIYLTGVSRAFETVAWGVCDGSPHAGFIVLKGDDDKVTLGHELTHAVIDHYQVMSCIDDYHWMNEATATWVQHFAYPDDNQEQGAAFFFLRVPEERLNLDEGLSGPHQYGAYLWFLSLAGQSNDPAPVYATWAAAIGRDSIEAIDAVNGGFAQNWKPFLARNWNRVSGLGQPHRDYHFWDDLDFQVFENHGGPQQIALPVVGGLRNPVHHDLLPLASQYDHFDFRGNDTARQIWIRNDYAGAEPRAQLQAIVKVRGRDWQTWADWTNDKVHFFCRDVADEDLEELVLIISNLDLASAQDFTGNTPRLGGDDTAIASPIELIATALPCHDWTASVEYHTTQANTGDDSRDSTTTELLFQLDLNATVPTMGAINYYRIANGQVHWNITQELDYCETVNVSSAFAAQGQLWISLGQDTLFYGLRNDAPGETKPVTIQCEGGPTELFYTFSEWMPSTVILPLPVGTTTIIGSQEYDPGAGTGEGWNWQLDKVTPP